MGVFTFEDEITTPIAPARLFKAFVLDADNLIPKVAPQAVKHVEILEGNGGPGTIKKINFADGNKFTYAKHRIDSIDHDNFTHSHTVIEGDVLVGNLEKISNETKIVASPDGGSIVKATNKFYTTVETPGSTKSSLRTEKKRPPVCSRSSKATSSQTLMLTTKSIETFVF